MTAILSNDAMKPRFTADAVLNAAARLWLGVAVIGQWVFVYYIVAFYGVSTVHGDFAVWRKNHALFKGYVPGDTAGNLAFAAHALLAAVIAFGGAVQLIPQIRTRVPALHRWNGRLFMITALGVSITGLYMVWVRHGAATLLGAQAISLNAVLIIAFVALAWRAAAAREFDSHRRWALRAYMVANGQWFFRVGIFAWIVVNGGPVGIGDDFDGPFVRFLGFGCYVVPLAFTELYLRAKDRPGPGGRLAMAGALVTLAALTAVGIVGLYFFGFRPVLGRL